MSNETTQEAPKQEKPTLTLTAPCRGCGGCRYTRVDGEMVPCKTCKTT